MKFYFIGDNYRKKELYESIFKMIDSRIAFEFISDEEFIELQNKIKFKVSYVGTSENGKKTKNKRIPVISVKESLYIDGLSKKEQPGCEYRKLKYIDEFGKFAYHIMNDREVVLYYSNLVKQRGGKLDAKLIDTVTIYHLGNVISTFDVVSNVRFTSSVSKIIPRGNPFHSMILVPEFGDIYLSECDSEERRFLYELRSDKILKNIDKILNSIETNDEKNIN